MAHIIEVSNAFEPMRGLVRHEHKGGITIREWLRETKGLDFVEFESPTVCLVNGNPLMRDQWDVYVIQKGDIINFITIVGDLITLIILIVMIIVMVVLALVMKPPETPGELPGSDPVFSIRGQKNEIRLGEPIEVNYGRNRIYPSYAAYPYYQYIDNDQFQHSLFCIGQGVYDIAAVQIGDTDILDYQEVAYEILPPGVHPTLFTANVETSVEVGGQTLYAANDPEWLAPGFVGPFTTNAPGTVLDKIEIDLVYPRGVYHTNKKGNLELWSVGATFEKRKIDNDGNPLEAWSILFYYQLDAATTTPQRRTITTTVPVGRYEVRGNHNWPRATETTYGSVVAWESMRGFVIGTVPEYGDVTMLCVRIRATNNLNSRTQEKFNVTATRKLPIRSSSDGTWSAPIATRSIVWAFADVFRSTYGGRVTDDSYLDWEALEALDALYESRNEHFDWTFRDPITIWEAAKAVARVGRAVPLLVGSLISMKRDGPLSIPVTLFSPENIAKESFQWDIKLWDPADNDSLMVEYTEPATGYKQENVLCILPGGTGDNPKDIRFPGIQNRDHAYHEGLYMLASERYLRENIAFDTGLEGYIPSYGDLVAVSHDVPRWGQSGYILDVQTVVAGTYNLFVSEPLVFDQSGDNHQILLRNKYGAVLGPVTVLETTDPSVVTISISPQPDWLLGGASEPMLFLFGPSGSVTKYGRVVKIEPQGEEKIKVTVVNEEPIIHSFDGLVAPALTKPPAPLVVPDLPIVTRLTLSIVDASSGIISAVWPPAYGAQKYLVQTSRDAGLTWTNRGDTARTSIQLQVEVGVVYVRVAAVNNGQGPWIQNYITVGRVAGLIVYLPWDSNDPFTSFAGDDLVWGVRWRLNDSTVEQYLVQVFDNTESAPVLKRQLTQLGTEFNYMFDRHYADHTLVTADNTTHTADYTTGVMAELDGNFNRNMIVAVDAMSFNNETGVMEADNAPATLSLYNDPAPAPADTSLVHSLVGTETDSTGGLSYTYDIGWVNPAVNDLAQVKIWFSENPNFDPTSAPASYSYTTDRPGTLGESLAVVYALVDNIHPDIYFWVGLGDCWGPEIATAGPQLIAPGWILTGGIWTDDNRWRDDQLWID